MKFAEILLLGLAFNGVAAIPYYFLIERPATGRDPRGRYEAWLGTVAISLVPWLYFAKTALLFALLAFVLARNGGRWPRRKDGDEDEE